jgi:subtilisin family serine protease
MLAALGATMSDTTTPEGGATPVDPDTGLIFYFSQGDEDRLLQHLRDNGFTVLTDEDLEKAPSIPNDLDGGDIQFFACFDIAVIRRNPQRVIPVLESAEAKGMKIGWRQERRYARRVPRPGRGSPALSPLELLPNEMTDSAAATWGLTVTGVTKSPWSGAGIKVAVLDSGFDDKHPDFVGRKVIKKVFATDSAEIDKYDHGTECTGIACGPLEPKDGLARYGIAHGAEIYAGKVFRDSDQTASERSLFCGLAWAFHNKCDIISLSVMSETGPCECYERIGQACLEAGLLVIAGIGNDADRKNNKLLPVGSPANASTIMAVGAIDGTLNVANFSRAGLKPRQNVDIVAPGRRIRSASITEGRYFADNIGTSFSTPHVAGIAALMAESDPSCRGWRLWKRLLDTARKLPLDARDVGAGLVQAPPPETQTPSA